MANNKKSSGQSNTPEMNGQIGGNMTKEAVERAKQTTDIEALKEEVAQELGITPGANSTASENGKLGGEMTRRLYQKGESSNSSSSSKAKSKSSSN